MNLLKKKWQELVYSLSTEDHYAEYDPNEPPAFNMGRRVNQDNPIGASRIHLNSNDEFGDEEMNVGIDDDGNDINIDEFGNSDNEGVSETLLAWRHIDSWTTKHNPDLNASLGDPCTHNDITHAEEDLAITFPASVKVSLRVHDGQEDLESMAGVSGLIYGLQLMTLDQIVEMTEKWRSVAKNLGRRSKANPPTESPSLSSVGPSIEEAKRKQFKLPDIPVQSSIPKDTIQPVYAHPAWIPLLTDNAGNHVGVDLAPASAGKYAQVIIFGRDFDTKFVVAKNWGDFLLDFANDLEAGNWYLIDDNDDFLAGDGELVFRDKKSNGPVQDYLEVLKRRAWRKAQDLKQQPVKESSASTTLNNNSEVNKASLLDDDSVEEANDTITNMNLPEGEEKEHTHVSSIIAEPANTDGGAMKDLKKPVLEKVSVVKSTDDEEDKLDANTQGQETKEQNQEADSKNILIPTEKDAEKSVKEETQSDNAGNNMPAEEKDNKHEQVENKNSETAEAPEDKQTKAVREEFESVAL